jgi:hypothetical protein
MRCCAVEFGGYCFVIIVPVDPLVTLAVPAVPLPEEMRIPCDWQGP